MIESNRIVLNDCVIETTTIKNNTQEKGIEEMIHNIQGDFYRGLKLLFLSHISYKSFEKIGFYLVH